MSAANDSKAGKAVTVGDGACIAGTSGAAVAAAVDPLPWDGFEGVVTTVAGLPPLSSLFVDPLSVASDNQLRAALPPVIAAATGLMPELCAFATAYAADGPSLLCGDTLTGAKPNGLWRVTPLTGAAERLIALDARTAVGAVDPRDGSVLATTSTTVVRFGRTGPGVAERPVVVAGSPGSSLDGAEDGPALTAATFTFPRFGHCSADGRELIVCTELPSLVRCIDTVAQTVTTIAGRDGSFENGSVENATLKGGVAIPYDAIPDPFHPADSKAPADLLIATADDDAVPPICRLNRRTGQLSRIRPVGVGVVEPYRLVATPSGWVLFTCRRTASLYAFDPRSGRTGLVAGTGRETKRPRKGGPSAAADGPARNGAAFDAVSSGIVLLPTSATPATTGPTATATAATAAADVAPPPLTVWVCDNHRVRAVTLAPFFAVPRSSSS